MSNLLVRLKSRAIGCVILAFLAVAIPRVSHAAFEDLIKMDVKKNTVAVEQAVREALQQIEQKKIEVSPLTSALLKYQLANIQIIQAQTTSTPELFKSTILNFGPLLESQFDELEYPSYSVLRGWAFYNRGWARFQLYRTTNDLETLAKSTNDFRSALNITAFPKGMRPDALSFIGLAHCRRATAMKSAAEWVSAASLFGQALRLKYEKSGKFVLTGIKRGAGIQDQARCYEALAEMGQDPVRNYRNVAHSLATVLHPSDGDDYGLNAEGRTKLERIQKNFEAKAAAAVAAGRLVEFDLGPDPIRNYRNAVNNTAAVIHPAAPPAGEPLNTQLIESKGPRSLSTIESVSIVDGDTSADDVDGETLAGDTDGETSADDVEEETNAGDCPTSCAQCGSFEGKVGDGRQRNYLSHFKQCGRCKADFYCSRTCIKKHFAFCKGAK